jgi:hypothetical protein
LELYHKVVELEDLEQVAQVVEQTLVLPLDWEPQVREIMEVVDLLVPTTHKALMLVAVAVEQEVQALTLLQ